MLHEDEELSTNRNIDLIQSFVQGDPDAYKLVFRIIGHDRLCEKSRTTTENPSSTKGKKLVIIP